MRKKWSFFTRHRLGIYNALINLAAILMVKELTFERLRPTAPEIMAEFKRMDLVFLPMAFLTISALTIWYEHPIRTVILNKHKNRPVGLDLIASARRRLLNYPYAVMAVDLAVWCLAAVVYSLLALELGQPWPDWFRPGLVSINNGLVAATMAFFVTEYILQKRLVPQFFPHGGLSLVSGTKRIRIGFRLAMVALATNLIPMLTILQSLYLVHADQGNPALTLAGLETTLFRVALIFLAVGIYMVFFVSANLTRPFSEILEVLGNVRRGRFNQKIPVRTNDEIGYTSDAINAMTEGLQERERMRAALAVAAEVQRNLLPPKDPEVPGLDVAGACFYCDDMGGDYYDYLQTPDADRFRLVVGDVSDHGVQSALLMATVRALIRQRSHLPGTIEEAVSDVNRALSQDVEETGHFMTMFAGEIDLKKKEMTWVVAGHDPPLLFDPVSDRFQHFDRGGMALGLMENVRFHQEKTPLAPGQILVVATDGVWETHAPNGTQFGKGALKDLIRKHADQPAGRILETVVRAVDLFRSPLSREDDLTLVVIKIE